MRREELEVLWDRYLAGETLSAEEERRLLEALEADPALRAEILQDEKIDGTLLSFGRLEEDADEFARGFGRRLGLEDEAGDFAGKVSSRMNSPRPSARRVHGAPEGPGRVWALSLAAAVALMALGGFLLRSWAPRPHPAAPPPTAKELRPPAPPPEPTPRPKPETAELPPAPQPTPAPSPAVVPPPAPRTEAPEESPADRRRRIEAEMRRALPGRKEATPAPRPDAPSVPAPKDPPRPAETRVVAATITGMIGEVHVFHESARRIAANGADVFEGEAVATAGDARALLLFGDGTWMALDGAAEVRELRAKGGKFVRLVSGSVRAGVTRQPAGEPMVFATPRAEATVLGTTLRIRVDDAATRLEVLEGKVRLKRAVDGKTVDVLSGHFAVATAGTELVSKPAVPENPALDLLATRGVLGINFGPAGVVPPDGFLGDSGALYDAKRGYGWIEPIRQVPDFLDVGQPLMTRNVKALPVVKDPLRDTRIGAGWKDIVQTWVMPVPNGRYAVTVSVGDGYPQGPHHVRVEDVQLVDSLITGLPGGRNFVERTALVTVKDGELTMVIGGGGKDFDGTSDTLMTHLIIRRASK